MNKKNIFCLQFLLIIIIILFIFISNKSFYRPNNQILSFKTINFPSSFTTDKIKKIMENGKIVIVDQYDWGNAVDEDRFKFLEERFIVRKLDVIDTFDVGTAKPCYIINIKKLILKDSNEQITYIAIPEFHSKNYVLQAQILYDFFEFMENDYNYFNIEFSCNADSNNLLKSAYEYRNKIKQDTNTNINLESIKDDALKYFVSKYQRMQKVLKQIEDFNKKNNFKPSKQWTWDKIFDIPEQDIKEKFIANHPEYPKNKIVYIPHKKGATYMFASDFHGNCGIKDSFKKVAQEFITRRKNGEDVTLILLGDYVDRGFDLLWDEIIDLYNKYPENVIILRGNHEEEKVSDFGFGKLNFGITYLKNNIITELYESLPLICIVRETKKNEEGIEIGHVLLAMHGAPPVEWVKKIIGASSVLILRDTPKSLIVPNIKDWLKGDDSIDISILQDWLESLEKRIPYKENLMSNYLQITNNYCKDYFKKFLEESENNKILRELFGENVKLIVGNVHTNCEDVNSIVITVCSGNSMRKESSPSYLYVDFKSKNKVFKHESILKPLNIKEFIETHRQDSQPKTRLKESIENLYNLKEISDTKDFVILDENLITIVNEIQSNKHELSKLGYSIENVDLVSVLKEFPDLYNKYIRILINRYIKKIESEFIIQFNSYKEKIYDYTVGYMIRESVYRLYDVTIPKIDMLKVHIATIIEKLLQEKFSINLGMKIYNIAEVMIKLFQLDVNINNIGVIDNNLLNLELETKNYRKFLAAI
jgi:hypothetical protein